MVGFTITNNEYFLPILFTVCSIFGWGGFYDLGTFIIKIIYDYKLSLCLFLVNFYMWILFLKRIQFTIDIQIKYIPRGNII